MLSDSLVQEMLLRLTQRQPLEVPRDLIPEFLYETNPLVSRQPSEGLNDLLRIHPYVTSHVTVLPPAGKVHPDPSSCEGQRPR